MRCKAGWASLLVLLLALALAPTTASSALAPPTPQLFRELPAKPAITVDELGFRAHAPVTPARLAVSGDVAAITRNSIADRRAAIDLADEPLAQRAALLPLVSGDIAASGAHEMSGASPDSHKSLLARAADHSPISVLLAAHPQHSPSMPDAQDHADFPATDPVELRPTVRPD